MDNIRKDVAAFSGMSHEMEGKIGTRAQFWRKKKLYTGIDMFWTNFILLNAYI